MKSLVVFIGLVFILQAVTAQDTSVNPKTCEDFLTQKTCDNLRRVAVFFKEATTTIQDAVTAAVKNHVTNAKDMLKFIRTYIAKSINCTTTFPQGFCDNVKHVGETAKLTALEIQLALEAAIEHGKTTLADVFNQTIIFMKTEITCERFLGQVACTNLQLALQKLGEQRSLLKEAIWEAAQKHYNQASDFLKAVKANVLNLISDFECETVMPDSTCGQLRDIAKALHLTVKQTREAIERAVLSGASQAKDIYKQVIAFLTQEINCEKILGPNSCTSLENSRKALHENVNLIKDVIMQAAIHNVKRTTDIILKIKQALVEKANNFTCTDVLPEKQCAFIQKIAIRFKIRAVDLKKVLVGAVVNGTLSPKQIYDVTLGALVAEARDLQCEDLIDSNICAQLKALANNLNIKYDKITLAIEEALVLGKDSIKDITSFAIEFLKESVSCDNFLSKAACDRIEELATRLHLNLKDIINKMKELYTNGVTKTTDIIKDIMKYIWQKFMGIVSKRSLQDSGISNIFDSIYKKINDVINKLKATDLSNVKEQAKKALKELESFTKQKIESIKAFLKSTAQSKDDVNAELAATYSLIDYVIKRSVIETVLL